MKRPTIISPLAAIAREGLVPAAWAGLRRRRLLGQGGALLMGLAAGAARAQDEFGDAALRGAGSTFVAPLMGAWVDQYRRDPYGVLERAPGGGLGDALSSDGLDYEPVGSLGGLQRMRAGSVDFAASEMPLSRAELHKAGLQQFAWVAGGVAVVVTGLGAGAVPLRLDGATLAGIYLGRITRWDDPAIAGLNPGRSLPAEAIRVLHRGDGSGTTYTLARFLAGRDADWARRVGVDLRLAWPVGEGVRGGEGMVTALGSTPLTIGYVNAVQARQAGLPIASLRNAAGRDVLPEPAAIAAALAAAPATPVGDEEAALPIDASGADSYPLVATVFGFAPASVRSARQRRAAAFLAWTLTQGGAQADRLGYRSLPASRTQAAAERLRGGGA